MNKITYRNLTFTHIDIVEGNCNTQHALAGESLSTDTLDFVVYCPSDAELDSEFLTADEESFLVSDEEVFICLVPTPLTEFVPGDPLKYYFNDELINKFYLSEVRRVGRGLYSFSCVSAIGLLDFSYHVGGMYSGTPISTVLEEILGGIDYEIDPVVETIKLYGWLPFDTKRSNLQQITIATALSIRTKSDGTLRLTALTSDPKGTFGTDRSAVDGAVESTTPCTAVQVVEHSFQPDDTAITLCSDSFLDEKIIIFPEPAHSLTITGGTITGSGANYAKVQGSGSVVLTGKKYIHTIKRITEGAVTGGVLDNVLTIDNATLITPLNSSAVAEKLYEAFSKPKAIIQDVLYGTERPGDVVSIINPYTMAVETACAKKLDIQFGTFLKASGEFLVDYIPSGVITGYQNQAVIMSNGTFTVPEGVTKIRAVLISGGEGGQAGQAGANGTEGTKLPSGWTNSGTWWTEAYNGEGGEGGLGGSGGQGGRVIDTGEIDVTPGQNISCTIGIGGEGGASNGATGSPGGDTVFGSYSTSTGAPTSTGYVDVLTGNIYGINGLTGFFGAKGRGRTNFAESRIVIISGIDGWGERYNGGAGVSQYYIISGAFVFGMGGSGGGAGWGSSGANGQAGSADYNNGHGFAQGGNGGNGSGPYNYTFASNIRGQGGHGGAGGGGGGGGGAYANFYGGATYEWPGAGGLGAAGSKGNTGGSGIIIIYY